MIIRKLLTAAPVCGLLAALACAALPATASADDGPPPRPPPRSNWSSTSAARCGPSDIDGGSRMAAAKQAFNEVLDATPAGASSSASAPSAPTTRATTARRAARTPRSSTRSARWTAPRRRRRWPRCSPPAGPRSAPRCSRRPTTSSGGDGTQRIVLITDGEDTCAAARPVRGGPRDRRQGHRPDHRHPRPGPRRHDPQRSSAASPRRPAAPTPRSSTRDATHRPRSSSWWTAAADPVVTPVATEGAAQLRRRARC